MNKASRFFTDYLLIPLMIPLCTGALSAYQARTEISATDYATLCEAWPHLHQPVRQQIADAIQPTGEISHWAYRKLSDAVMADSGFLLVSDTKESVAQARGALRSLIASTQN